MQAKARTGPLLKASAACCSAKRVTTWPVSSRPVLPRPRFAQVCGELLHVLSQLQSVYFPIYEPLGKRASLGVQLTRANRKTPVTATSLSQQREAQRRAYEQGELTEEVTYLLATFVGLPLVIFLYLYPYLQSGQTQGPMLRYALHLLQVQYLHQAVVSEGRVLLCPPCCLSESFAFAATVWVCERLGRSVLHELIAILNTP